LSGHGTDDNSLLKGNGGYWHDTNLNNLAADITVKILYNSNGNDPTKARTQTITL